MTLQTSEGDTQSLALGNVIRKTSSPPHSQADALW